MAWMMDTYANMVGASQKQAVKGVVTGKPVASGGTLGRAKATGQGMVFCILEWAKETGFNLEGSTMIVQGFGNVGSNCAVILSKLGVSTIAVGDHTGYMYNPEGFNAHKLQDYVEAHGVDRRLPGRQGDHARGVLRDEGRHLRPVRARESDRRGGGEGAPVQARRRRRQRPDEPGRASSILLDRGIDILPDVLANSGASRSATTSGCRTSARRAGPRKRSTRSSRRRCSAPTAR